MGGPDECFWYCWEIKGMEARKIIKLWGNLQPCAPDIAEEKRKRGLAPCQAAHNRCRTLRQTNEMPK
jgi:hypothetical protein